LGNYEPARDRLGRSGSPAESAFELVKSTCDRPAAGGTPARWFMEGTRLWAEAEVRFELAPPTRL